MLAGPIFVLIPCLLSVYSALLRGSFVRLAGTRLFASSSAQRGRLNRNTSIMPYAIHTRVNECLSESYGSMFP